MIRGDFKERIMAKKQDYDIELQKIRSRIIGDNIKKHRKRSGYSQTEMAELLGVYSHGTISQAERGEREISANELFRLHLIFKIPMERFFDGCY